MTAVTAVPSPSAAQVRALLDRAASGRLTPDEQRLVAAYWARDRKALASTSDRLRSVTAERDRYARDAQLWCDAAASSDRNRQLAEYDRDQAIGEAYQLRQQLAARDDQHAPASVDCPCCPARAGRPCRAPSGQQVPYHTPRRIAAQQAAGVGQ